MKEKLRKEIKTFLQKAYQRIRDILLDADNYANQEPIDNVAQYIRFVESSLERQYSRILHLYHFIETPDQFHPNRTYPLCYLSPAARGEIYGLYLQMLWLMEGFESFDREGANALILESHEATLSTDKVVANASSHTNPSKSAPD